jgi:hypothetical protein
MGLFLRFFGTPAPLGLLGHGINRGDAFPSSTAMASKETEELNKLYREWVDSTAAVKKHSKSVGLFAFRGACAIIVIGRPIAYRLPQGFPLSRRHYHGWYRNMYRSLAISERCSPAHR